MISEIQSADLAARVRYASNLFDFIRERIEERVAEQKQEGTSLSISPGNSEGAFCVQTSSRTIEVKANDPEGSISLKYTPASGKSQLGAVELSDCRYPWDCKVSLKRCEWLDLDSGSSRDGSPSPSLMEQGERIASALVGKLFEETFENSSQNIM